MIPPHDPSRILNSLSLQIGVICEYIDRFHYTLAQFSHKNKKYSIYYVCVRLVMELPSVSRNRHIFVGVWCCFVFYEPNIFQYNMTCRISIRKGGYLFYFQSKQQAT